MEQPRRTNEVWHLLYSEPFEEPTLHYWTTTGDVADYTLRSFPLYMAELAFRSSPQ